MSYKKAPKVKKNKSGRYPMRSQDIFNFAKRLDPIIYRMGDQGLFQAVGEYEEYYTGHWRTSLRSQSVLKGELRKLTDEEFEYWNSRYEIICGIKVPLKITRD